MKKFYDREDELKVLNRLVVDSEKSARFTYIVGQRRVGKTFLIRQAYLDHAKLAKNTLYFFVGRKTEEVLAKEFSAIVAGKIGYVPNFTSVTELLLFLFDYAKNKPLTVVFDEFQNFYYSAPEVFSGLQKIWDENKRRAKINLICIGSLYSFMEKIFASRHEPLFGRVTGKIVLKPLKTTTIKTMLRDKKVYSFSYLLELYAMFDGVAKYYEYLEDYGLFGKSPEVIFKRLFLEADAPLATEGKDLLMEEFSSDYQTFFSILEVIAHEKNISNQKIANAVGINLNNASTYLARLEKRYNLIKRDTPLTVTVSKRGLYKIKDKLLKLWFTVVFSNLSLMESGQKEVMTEVFKAKFQTIKGVAFEDLVAELVASNYLQFPYSKWGKYWDKQVEIDLLGLAPEKNELLLCECKLKSAGDWGVLVKELIRKKEVLQKVFEGKQVKMALFLAHEVKASALELFRTNDIAVYDSKALDGFI